MEVKRVVGEFGRRIGFGMCGVLIVEGGCRGDEMSFCFGGGEERRDGFASIFDENVQK